jgi:hemolysin-activating ACP:hemolysin acyltransferase
MKKTTKAPAKKTKKSVAEAKTVEPEISAPAPEVDENVMKRIAQLRNAVRQTFGSVAMSMMALPRYRHLAIGDLQHLVLEPLVRDRIVLARKKGEEGPLADIAGMAIWASVTEEVDAKIREQIAEGIFPIRLGADEWTGGNINWLFDVIAPNAEASGAVVANFKSLVTQGELRLHPLISRLVDKDTLETMGAKAMKPKADVEPA